MKNPIATVEILIFKTTDWHMVEPDYYFTSWTDFKSWSKLNDRDEYDIVVIENESIRRKKVTEVAKMYV
jgi:hypothetical protein